MFCFASLTRRGKLELRLRELYAIAPQNRHRLLLHSFPLTANTASSTPQSSITFSPPPHTEKRSFHSTDQTYRSITTVVINRQLFQITLGYPPSFSARPRPARKPPFFPSFDNNHQNQIWGASPSRGMYMPPLPHARPGSATPMEACTATGYCLYHPCSVLSLFEVL